MGPWRLLETTHAPVWKRSGTRPCQNLSEAEPGVYLHKTPSPTLQSLPAELRALAEQLLSCCARHK